MPHLLPQALEELRVVTAAAREVSLHLLLDRLDLQGELLLGITHNRLVLRGQLVYKRPC